MSEPHLVEGHGYWSSAVQAFDEVRGPNGEPSLNDFRSMDHREIRSRIVTAWNTLPPAAPGSAYRVFTHVGLLAVYVVIAIHNQRLDRQEIELVDLHVDLYPSPPA